MIALGVVVVMLFGVSSVYAIDPGVSPGHGWMHGQKTRDQWKGLNLTPEQKAKFQELHRKFIVVEPSKVNVATRILSK
jgi:Spy/CpxP family protein refolding chaperone